MYLNYVIKFHIAYILCCFTLGSHARNTVTLSMALYYYKYFGALHNSLLNESMTKTEKAREQQIKEEEKCKQLSTNKLISLFCFHSNLMKCSCSCIFRFSDLMFVCIYFAPRIQNPLMTWFHSWNRWAYDYLERRECILKTVKKWTKIWSGVNVANKTINSCF